MDQTEKNNQKQITTKEAATLLGVAETTILTYSRQNLLIAVNEKNWQLDNTKYFYEEDVVKLREKLKKPGLTTGEVAKQLGVSTVTIFNYINDGQLYAEKAVYRGRELFFITQEEFIRFYSTYRKSKKKKDKGFYSKHNKHGWFQLFTHTTSGEVGRLMVSEEEELFLLTKRGLQIQYELVEEYGFKPAYTIERGKNISKRKFVTFQFPYEHSIDSKIYSFIDTCYEYITPTNMRISVCDQTIELEIKPYRFQEDILDEDTIQFIKAYIVEGSIIPTGRGIYVDSEYNNLSIEIPAQVKNSLKLLATERNVTLEEMVSKVLEEYVIEKQQD